jgi:two-component system, LuxR family, sensor kinase FixL
MKIPLLSEDPHSLLEAIVGSSGDAIFSKTLGELVLSWNSGAEQLYGYSASEMIGRSVSVLVPEDRKPELAAILQRLAEGQQVAPFETVRRRKDGHLVDVSVTISLLRDATGKIIGASTIARDITKRKQVEATLRESEAQKGAMFETALDAIVTMNHLGNIVEFNPAAEKTFGYTRQEVVGLAMAELIIPASLRERHRRGLAHYLATGEGPVMDRRIEIVALRKDGSEFPIELAITRVPQAGDHFFIGTIRDITERKQAQEQQRMHQEHLMALATTGQSVVF